MRVQTILSTYSRQYSIFETGSDGSLNTWIDEIYSSSHDIYVVSSTIALFALVISVMVLGFYMAIVKKKTPLLTSKVSSIIFGGVGIFAFASFITLVVSIALKINSY